MKKENLTFARLILAMHEATKTLGFYAQRDTMHDIAELDDLFKECPEDGFTRPWSLRENGTHLGYGCDFEPVAQYTIRYYAVDANHPYGTWSIEQEEA